MRCLFCVALISLMIVSKTYSQQQPFTIINGIEAGLVEMESILKVDSLRCSEPSYEIFSFSLTLSLSSGDYLEIKSNSDKITQEMRTSLSRPDFSKSLWFENIKAKNSDGKELILPSVKLQIR